MISTYVINLEKRKERKQHIYHEFSGKEEFNLLLVKAIRDKVGAVGLWKTLVEIISDAIPKKGDYILVCEDDHQFTNSYSFQTLSHSIRQAAEIDADIVLGGVSWFSSILKATDNLYWAEKFTGTQFMIIFKSAFKQIIDVKFTEFDSSDFKLSDIFKKIFFIHPFISIQKDFGYSDITSANNVEGRVKLLFKRSSDKVIFFNKINRHYKEKVSQVDNLGPHQVGFSLPTYVFFSEEAECHAKISSQFDGRDEFLIKKIGVKRRNGYLNYWLEIRLAIEDAISNDDEVIIICNENHQFSDTYNARNLFECVVEGYLHGLDCISGNVTDFDMAIPISNKLIWINRGMSLQFLIIYSQFFKEILKVSYDKKDNLCHALSNLSLQMAVIFPFISCQQSSKNLLNDDSAKVLQSIIVANSCYSQYM